MEDKRPDLRRREQDWTPLSPFVNLNAACPLPGPQLRHVNWSSVSQHAFLSICNSITQDASEKHNPRPKLSYQSPGAGA